MSTSVTSTASDALPAGPGARFDTSCVLRSERAPSLQSHWRALPRGLAGMIGLILVVECFTARNWLDFSDPISLSWRYSAHAARYQAPGCELLCLGDSLVKHGLVPSVMQETSGKRTVNLAAARCPTLMTYFLLERALDSGARPQAIVFNAKPAVLTGGLDFTARYWQEVLTFREITELLKMYRRASVLGPTIVGTILPSLRSRLELRSNLMAALRGETDQLHDINRVLWRNWTVNGGANVAHPTSSFTGEVTPEVASRLLTGIFHVDHTNAEGIERLLSLAATRRVPVFWLLPPLSPALQSMRDKSGAEARYEKLVRSYHSRYSHVVTVLDARRAAYSSEMFVDATHLSARGAVALSHAVALAILRESARPMSTPSRRWVKLDPPGTRDTLVKLDSPLEDIEQSRRALQRN